MWEQKAEKKRNEDKCKKLETRLTPTAKIIFLILFQATNGGKIVVLFQKILYQVSVGYFFYGLYLCFLYIWRSFNTPRISSLQERSSSPSVLSTGGSIILSGVWK